MHVEVSRASFIFYRRESRPIPHSFGEAVVNGAVVHAVVVLAADRVIPELSENRDNVARRDVHRVLLQRVGDSTSDRGCVPFHGNVVVVLFAHIVDPVVLRLFVHVP